MESKKIKIEIKSLAGFVLFSYETEDNTIKRTLEEAVRQKADLSGSDLSGSDLSGSDLSGSNLSGSNLSGSDLRGSNLSGSNLSWSDLRNVKFENLPQQWVEVASRDILFVFEHLKSELPKFRKMLLAGKVDGTAYTGDCVCLVGSFAKIKKPNATDKDVDKVCEFIPFYTKSVQNPGEEFFLSIRAGDTPENSEFAKHVLTLIDMVLGKKTKVKSRK